MKQSTADCYTKNYENCQKLSPPREIISAATHANNSLINPPSIARQSRYSESWTERTESGRENALATFVRIFFLLPTHSTPFSPSWFCPFCLTSPHSSPFFSIPFSLLILIHSLSLVIPIFINFTPINISLRALKTLSLSKSPRFTVIEEHITNPEASCDNTTIYSRCWRCSQLATFTKEGKPAAATAPKRGDNQQRRPLRSIRCRRKFSNKLPPLSSEKGGHPPRPNRATSRRERGKGCTLPLTSAPSLFILQTCRINLY